MASASSNAVGIHTTSERFFNLCDDRCPGPGCAYSMAYSFASGAFCLERWMSLMAT